MTVLRMALQKGHYQLAGDPAAHGATVDCSKRLAYVGMPHVDWYDLERHSRFLCMRIRAKARNEVLPTLSHIAAQYADDETMSYFLAHKKDVDVKDILDVTPLHVAAWSGSVSSTQALLSAGARADQSSKWSLSPLFLAVVGSHVNAVKLLLKHGAKVNRAMPSTSAEFLFPEEGFEGIFDTDCTQEARRSYSSPNRVKSSSTAPHRFFLRPCKEREDG